MERMMPSVYEYPNFNLETVTTWSRRIMDYIEVPTVGGPKKFNDLDHAVAWLMDELSKLEFHLPTFETWDSYRCQQAILRWAASDLKKCGKITWTTTPEIQKSADASSPPNQANQASGSAHGAFASSDDELLRHMARQSTSQYEKGFMDGYAQALENVRALRLSETSSCGTNEKIDENGEANLAQAFKAEDSS